MVATKINSDYNVTLRKILSVYGKGCIEGNFISVQKIIQQSSDSGLIIHAKNDDGFTGFMFACLQGHVNIVNLILNHKEGRNALNAQNRMGENGFIIACKNDQSQVIKMILEHPNTTFDSVNARNLDGDRALDIALRNPLRFQKIRRMLLSFYE